ncbi:hypothetical protein [Rhodopila sp.]|uniref:hypothetical protein n=1 Tax=Rhodopila sp. TaxID=2480087 RepID=UPI003D104F1C
MLDLQADEVDIFFGLIPTPQRALAIDFTHPLFNNLFTLIARPGFRPATGHDLNNWSVRIALEIGTSYDQIISESCPDATLIRLKTNNEATLAVQAGRADCQVLVALLALSVLKRDPGIGALVVPKPLSPRLPTPGCGGNRTRPGAILWTTGSTGAAASVACAGW